MALEAALSKPENEFLNVMLPLLNPPKEENLQILSRVLEHGSVVDKRYTAKLLRIIWAKSVQNIIRQLKHKQTKIIYRICRNIRDIKVFKSYKSA